jgi:S-adenosylmethionine-diacylglycerol 3-amino-3-carboxypropyl transferase
MKALARENFMLGIVFCGKFHEQGLPAYLHPGSFQTLQNRLDRVKTVTSDILDFLKRTPDCTFSKFSMSDLASHLNQSQFHVLLQEIVRTAKPGARFCIRQFLSRHVIPQSLAGRIQRNYKLEAFLREEDRSFVYDFFVGCISK